MNEEITPYAPPRAPVSDELSPDLVAVRGSFAAGIGLFFLCLLISGVIVFVGGWVLVAAMPEAIDRHHIALLTLLVPWPAVLVFGVGVVIKGRIRTAFGMLAGFGILAAVLLVLGILALVLTPP